MATKKLQLMGVKLVNQEDYGLSAYEIAVNNGFKGSEEEWLASLKPTKGVDYYTTEEQERIVADTAAQIYPVQFTFWSEDE